MSFFIVQESDFLPINQRTFNPVGFVLSIRSFQRSFVSLIFTSSNLHEVSFDIF